MRPVFLAADVAADRLVLDGPEGRHAATVRRLRAGEQVDVVDGLGTRAVCAVVEVGRDVVALDVVAREVEPEPAPRIVLVQALAKGDRGELAVELATEVGVDEVVPWAAERCVVRWEGPRGAKALERWRATAREAGKQSRRARLPQVADPAGTAQVAARLAGTTALLLHESAEEPLATAALPSDGEVVLVVGPEGGLSDRELAVLREAGGRAVRLGRSVLRTSTAGAVAAGVVSARTGRWS
ncbi:MAG TPA: 16S rRNA (uracil(1498)-N(3))-methyltransferase [Mycobacteriales bacterium]|nr:16S rRNA (uracil(1498)-N(3))-methyltransferase [Mycobacteriales bacterium]